MFAQIIRMRTQKFDQLAALSKEMEGERAEQSPGFLGFQLLRSRDDPADLTGVAWFESYEKAMQNSSRPETSAFAERMAALLEGTPEYINCDLAYEVNERTGWKGIQAGVDLDQTAIGMM